MRPLARFMAVGALALGMLGLIGGTAGATTPTLTLTQPSTSAVDGAPFTLTATASEAGTVAFSANSTTIPGCATEVTVASGSNFVATCPWTAPLTTTSPVSIDAVLTPTVVADGDATAPEISVNTTPVALTGSVIYLGQNVNLVATAYSLGSVTFSEGNTTLCSSVANAINGNGTAYTASCAYDDPSAGGLITAAFTPNNGSDSSGSATYPLVVNTVVISGGAGAVVGDPNTITADANESGTMQFDTVVDSVPTAISGCGSVTTASTAVPYVFTCTYTASAVGSATLQATLTPGMGSPETSNNLTVTAADVVLSGGSAIYTVSPGTIVATTTSSGTVTFQTIVDSVPTTIPGCSDVATLPATPIVALCTWTPTAAGPAVLGAVFTPGTGPSVTASDFDVTVGTPIQGQEYPISMYVDTINASGPTGTPTSPIIGAGCEITNEFLVGQTIVFRVYGNDAELGGAPLSTANVASAYVTIAGYASSPIKMNYGIHAGEAFYTGVLSTGTGTNQYDTLGVIPYTVTIKTNAVAAVPAVTKKVKVFKRELVNVRVGNKIVKEWRRVLVGTKTVIVTPAKPAIPGATGTFNSAFNPASQATLNAVPTV